MATQRVDPQPIPGPGGEGWRDYHKRVRPLAPDIRVRVAEQIAGRNARVLLLGVTRDYAELGDDLTAVDFCREQIANVWIGDRPGRRAILADWREMDFQPGSFTSAVGDGSLSPSPGRTITGGCSQGSRPRWFPAGCWWCAASWRRTSRRPSSK